jgi:hypothetical protein
MADDEGVVILCFRVGNPRVLIVDGMSKEKCEKCRHDVWIAPSSLKMKEKFKATVVCDVCQPMRSMPFKDILPLNNEQISEIKDALWNRKTRN